MRLVGLRSYLVMGLLTATIIGCGKTDTASSGADDSSATAAAAAPTGPVNGPTDQLVKISQFGGSLYCSIASSADGTLHAIYSDRADPTKVMYLYYRASKDGGATWTDPKNLSDDESGLSSYYCKCMTDSQGRVYAVWKYLTAASDTLDGPGSACCGILAYRCLDGGNWSKAIKLSTKNVPSTSFFAASGPDGKVNVVWAAGNTDVDWVPEGGVQCFQGNMIQQVVLDGANPPTPKGLIVPKPIPTQAQINAAHAAGNDIPNLDQRAHQDGLWNLRGYIDKAGVAHFVGEHYSEYATGGSSKGYYVEWDGKSLHKLWTIDHVNNLNNPPTLLCDANGKEHLIRTPEHSEKEAVRDYAMANKEVDDGADIIGPDKIGGSVVDWQAEAMPNGKMVVTAAVSQKGGWAPDDTELYATTFDGVGQWSKPVCITNNAARQAFMDKQTAAGGVSKSDTYRPDFADAVSLPNGGVGVLMVNTCSSIIGITKSGVTRGGQVVGSLGTVSTSAPWVFYRKF